MSKPFSIQSPENIAKEYGGNKQKIGQAMQLGVVDATAGVLAGMFIDRMRSAQMQEMSNPPTVAQQVMGGVPPQPAGLPAPGGAGMPPQGAPPMAPGMGGPPPGMSGPPPGMGAPPPDMGAMPPPEGPPMGMAEGGIVGLDIPETLFDESSNGGFDEGYAGGGLVAFGPGGIVGGEDPLEYKDPNEIVVERSQAPDNYYGNYINPEVMRDEVKRFYDPKSVELDKLTKYYSDTLTPESQKARFSEDKWAALAAMASKMGQTPGSFLQGINAGLGEANKMLSQSRKERRAEKIDAMKSLVQNERMSNKDAFDLYTLTRAGQDKYGEFNEKNLDRKSQKELERIKGEYGLSGDRIRAAAQLSSARISASSYSDVANKQAAQLERQARLEAPKLAMADLQGINAFQIAQRNNDTATMDKMIKERTQYHLANMGIDSPRAADAGQGRAVSQGKIVSAVPIPR
jgi:hypothetical protein